MERDSSVDGKLNKNYGEKISSLHINIKKQHFWTTRSAPVDFVFLYVCTKSFSSYVRREMTCFAIVWATRRFSCNL